MPSIGIGESRTPTKSTESRLRRRVQTQTDAKMINFKQPQGIVPKPQPGTVNNTWWPACLCAEDAARYLGWPQYILTILASAGHIKPLGRPSQNSRKWYARVELDRLGGDAEWLDKAILIAERRVNLMNGRRVQSANCPAHIHNSQ